MQIKVVIGTVAFMLVMVILGVAAIFEPARLQETSLAYTGRQIEKGAVIFQQTCVECHGLEGRAQACQTFAGEEIPCKGLPLNHAPLLCGEPSQRMQQMNWSSSKQNFIRQTISAGRPGTLMPVWSANFGGPMEDYKIDQVTDFILNWANDPDLCGEEGIVAVEWPENFDELPAGDAANGPAAYQTYGCFACHGDPQGASSSATVGPWLGNIGNDASTRVEGLSAAQYIYESIMDPNAFIAPQCPNGPCPEPSPMRMDYPNIMNEQDMADLVEYYLTLTSE